jgi:hypothetical protein
MMAHRILSVGLSVEASNSLHQTMAGVEAAEEEGVDAVKARLIHSDGWSLVILGPKLSADQCADLNSWLAVFLPHVRALMVVDAGQVEKLISVKNRVTALAAIQFPWEQTVLRELIEDLLSRSDQSRREHDFLGASLAKGLLNVRQTRVTTLYQLLAQQHNGESADRLLTLIEAAIALQDDQTKALMGNHDLLSYVQAEARRMAGMLAHIREWHSTFQKGVAVRSLHGLFTVEEGSLVIRDIHAQLQPLNGPPGGEPTLEQCCLLALLTWPPSRATLNRRTDGAWVARVDEDVAQRDSSLLQMLAAA